MPAIFTLPTVTSRRLLIALVLGGAALALALGFFSPRWWLMRQPVPGSFQWSRAEGFLLQCSDPFRRDIEPALHWRLLPPLVAHTLGLRGYAPLLLPWLGALLLLTTTAHIFLQRLSSARLAFFATVPICASFAVLSSVNFLGVNDSWAWLALLLATFARPRWVLPIACLLGPWIDERFVIGLPLALIVRALDRSTAPAWSTALPLLWLAPYLAARLLAPHDASTHFFLSTHLRMSVGWLALAPFGWWMSFRAGWLAIIAAFALMPTAWRPLVLIAAFAELAVMPLIAADLSRSGVIVFPLLIWGLLALARRYPEHAPRLLGALAVAALLIPAANVVATKLDPIDSLPVELYRFLRSP